MPQTDTSADPLAPALRARLRDIAGGTVNMSPDVDRFSEMGLDSIAMMMITSEIEEAFDLELPPHLLWDIPTLSQFAAYLRERVDPARLDAFVRETGNG